MSTEKIAGIAGESPTVFEVDGEELVGILHGVAGPADIAVLVIVGGPQYRVGSHRQFVLLGRALAQAGIPALRFDYRGIGDSSGATRGFESIDADIHGAIDVLTAHTGVKRVVLWGLCDAASAALMYAYSDPRVVGLVLLNPWVHSAEIEAKTRLKTYYTGRLRSIDFWRKLSRLDMDMRDSLSSLWRYARGAARGERHRGDDDEKGPRDMPAAGGGRFIERMYHGWRVFNGATLLILSGDDLTAAEFRQLTTGSPDWKALVEQKGARTIAVPNANHTFTRAEWRLAVEHATVTWVRELAGGDAQSA